MQNGSPYPPSGMKLGYSCAIFGTSATDTSSINPALVAERKVMSSVIRTSKAGFARRQLGISRRDRAWDDLDGNAISVL